MSTKLAPKSRRATFFSPQSPAAASSSAGDLKQWFGELDQFQDRIPLPVLTRGLERLRIDFAALEPFVRFSSERYLRNLIHAGPAYHALLLCWLNGQRSP